MHPSSGKHPISTRINRTETLFPCPPFLLFMLCFLARFSWNLCSSKSWSNYYYYSYCCGIPRSLHLGPVWEFTSLPCQEAKCSFEHHLWRKNDPRLRKSAYGVCWASFGVYRLALDSGREKNTFLAMLENKWAKPERIFTICSGTLSQSIGCGLISREASLVVRESLERGDKNFARKTEKRNFGL